MNVIERLARLASLLAEEHERREELVIANEELTKKVSELQAEKKQLIDQLAKAEDMSR